MNRRSLQDLLDREGVSREVYRLDGAEKDQALTLAAVEGGWQVWFNERGRKFDGRSFDTEDAACDHLADSLLSDDSNRWVLAAGPAEPHAADRGLDTWLSALGTSREQLPPSALRVEDLPGRQSQPIRRYWVLRTTTRTLPVTVVPAHLVDQILKIDEFRMGVWRVDVELRDGTIVRDVITNGVRVSWVCGGDTIPFRSEDITAIRDPFRRRSR